MEDAVSVHVVDGLAQLVHVQLDPLFRQIGLAVCSHKGVSKLSAEGGEGRGGEEYTESRGMYIQEPNSNILVSYTYSSRS